MVGAFNITASFREDMLNILVIHAIKQHLIENRETFKEELELQMKALFSKQKTKSDIEKELESLNKKLQSFLEIFEENPSKTIAKKIQEYEEKIRLLELEIKSFEEIVGVKIDNEVINIFLDQIDNVLKMDVSQAREIKKMFLKK